MNEVVVLGATGSIGRQALEVASQMNFVVRGVAARRGSSELLSIASELPEAIVAVSAPTAEERERFSELGGRATFGQEAVDALAGIDGVTVVNGVVGAAGLSASVAALEAGNRLALANKESLVAGGPVIEKALATPGAELVPVDSEHSALFQLLAGRERSEIRRLILSASGGPFRGMTPARLAEVTPEQALKHPTWEMGPRITIDSATLMNKALEVIEAHFLFGFDYDDIEVIVHPQSIVHSLVELVDGSLLAHMGQPDMRLPLRYAFTHPGRARSLGRAFSLPGVALTFEDPDLSAFPCLRLGYEAGRAGGSAPAVLNAADEIAVRAFLDGRIGFNSIPVVVERTLADVEHRPVGSVEDVLEADEAARAVAAGHVGSC